MIYHGQNFRGIINKAKEMIFDNTGTDLISTNAEDAIKELDEKVSHIGVVHRKQFNTANKNYSANETIDECTVDKGVYIATFTPGYGTSTGNICFRLYESNVSQKGMPINLVSSGWSKGSMVAIIVVNTDNSKIQFAALEACSWQGNEADFVVVRIA